MLYYSIYPPEVILSEEEPEQKEVQREIEVAGKRMIVTVGAQGEQRISRLLSTDPNDYLDPRWTPGNMIF